ncbi:M23 family metallopeptidase [Streptomyces sp. MBT49]|uniref:M23 family metallopeptidase n=1 Tax=Streptomyces sp. MBT49 TaxID=1488380 RepID=UPI00190D5410|nr:M23 family metallopeptidase [Streptomyces sp. MBT49]MBK3629212.1 M23 family metallopeptidase [Streptomyces sp. MBT49]
MAFTCATGKHRRPGRTQRGTVRAAGIAVLTTTGVMATVASTPAFAAEPTPEQTGLIPVVAAGESVVDQIDDQVAVQKQAAFEEAARQAAAKKAVEERAARVRAAREAERKLLNTFVSPITGSYVSTGYQASSSLWSSGSHTGIDFHAASGTSVHAVGSGTVVEAGWGGSYGNQIVIKMNDGTYTQYGHLSSIEVSVGQQVTPGRRIGLSGATGNVTGPHLHFEARTTAEYGSDIDPVAYLRNHGVNV